MYNENIPFMNGGSEKPTSYENRDASEFNGKARIKVIGVGGAGNNAVNRMIEAGIKEGDLLVIKKQNTAEDGEIVVALIEGEATLKRFYKKGKKIILHPENKTMQDIVLSNCEIQGVLVSCIKLFG